MATTSIWRVGGWLGKVVIYVENPDKTENPATYAVSYMLCKRYGIEAKGYDIGRLNSVFKGQDPREDVPAALSDMRETFKSLNGRMARAMGLTRDTKQKEPER